RLAPASAETAASWRPPRTAVQEAVRWRQGLRRVAEVAGLQLPRWRPARDGRQSTTMRDPAVPGPGARSVATPCSRTRGAARFPAVRTRGAARVRGNRRE